MSDSRPSDSRPSDSPLMPTAYYDAEADRYDESRGGADRARAAASAIASLVPGEGLLLDVAGGTGAVSAALAGLGWTPAVIDLSAGMLELARRRMPGRVLRGSADRLPLRDATVDLVTVIWMLNLVPVSVVDTVIAEAARVLRPGGSLVVTVDKERAHDVGVVELSDGDERISAVAAALGLDRTGTTTFRGRSPWGSATDRDPEFRLAAFRRVAVTV